MSITQRQVVEIISDLREIGGNMKEAGRKDDPNLVMVKAGPLYAGGESLEEIANQLLHLIPDEPLHAPITIEEKHDGEG